jgi:hypothetical protein
MVPAFSGEIKPRLKPFGLGPFARGFRAPVVGRLFRTRCFRALLAHTVHSDSSCRGAAFPNG